MNTFHISNYWIAYQQFGKLTCLINQLRKLVVALFFLREAPNQRNNKSNFIHVKLLIFQAETKSCSFRGL
jgi:hypothetical protein